MPGDLEEECWNVYRDAEDPAHKLKALDLLVKIRCAGAKVKGDGEEQGRDEGRAKMRAQVLDELKWRAKG